MNHLLAALRDWTHCRCFLPFGLCPFKLGVLHLFGEKVCRQRGSPLSTDAGIFGTLDTILYVSRPLALSALSRLAR